MMNRGKCVWSLIMIITFICGPRLASAQVTITSMPGEYKRQLGVAFSEAGAGWDDLEERQDCARSRLDGIYFFLDLPEGKYTLKAIDFKSGKQDEKRVSVSWDKKQNIRVAQADFKISAG